jgi:hypothetical protein
VFIGDGPFVQLQLTTSDAYDAMLNLIVGEERIDLQWQQQQQKTSSHSSSSSSSSFMWKETLLSAQVLKEEKEMGI